MHVHMARFHRMTRPTPVTTNTSCRKTLRLPLASRALLTRQVRRQCVRKESRVESFGKMRLQRPAQTYSNQNMQLTSRHVAPSAVRRLSRRVAARPMCVAQTPAAGAQKAANSCPPSGIAAAVSELPPVKKQPYIHSPYGAGRVSMDDGDTELGTCSLSRKDANMASRLMATWRYANSADC